MSVPEGQLVRVHSIILNSGERGDQLPEDTRNVPLEMWVKGTLLTDAELGDEVVVTTITGRRVSGILIDEAPSWNHGFGVFIPELEEIGHQLRQIIREGRS